MTPTWIFSASLLLAAAQANSLYPASTFPLRMLHRSPRFGNERTLYTGFQPPLQSESYEDYDNVASTRTLDVASTRTLGCGTDWTEKGDLCYKLYQQTTGGGWTWDQARRHCKTQAYSEGHTGADLAFPMSDDDNNFVKGLLQNEDVWLGAKFPNKLQKKTSTNNPETWGDYTGYTNWREGVTPARGISNERRLLMKGDSVTLGKWVVWNGMEKKGFVCQFKKKGCRNGWTADNANNLCLKVFNDKMTWANAQRKCEEQGLNGNLASTIAQNIVEELAQQTRRFRQGKKLRSDDDDNAQATPEEATILEPEVETILEPELETILEPEVETTLEVETTPPVASSNPYRTYWLGGSVQYENDGSLSYTWTDGDDGEVWEGAWANGYNTPTPWTGTVNTFINNEKKIGLNPGNDKAYFICQYDVPSSVSDNLIHTGIFGGRRRSLF